MPHRFRLIVPVWVRVTGGWPAFFFPSLMAIVSTAFFLEGRPWGLVALSLTALALWRWRRVYASLGDTSANYVELTDDGLAVVCPLASWFPNLKVPYGFIASVSDAAPCRWNPRQYPYPPGRSHVDIQLRRGRLILGMAIAWVKTIHLTPEDAAGFTASLEEHLARFPQHATPGR